MPATLVALQAHPTAQSATEESWTFTYTDSSGSTDLYARLPPQGRPVPPVHVTLFADKRQNPDALLTALHRAANLGSIGAEVGAPDSLTLPATMRVGTFTWDSVAGAFSPSPTGPWEVYDLQFEEADARLTLALDRESGRAALCPPYASPSRDTVSPGRLSTSELAAVVVVFSIVGLWRT